MSIKNYIYPNLVLKSLKENIKEIQYYKKYTEILKDLEKSEKLKEYGMTLANGKLYFGVDLNPELLLYSEESQKQVELNFISDKMRRYTDFLNKEGVLDVIKADYDRVLTPDYYGYIIQIEFDFKKYKRSKFIFDISYFSTLMLALLVSLFLILK